MFDMSIFGQPRSEGDCIQVAVRQAVLVAAELSHILPLSVHLYSLPSVLTCSPLLLHSLTVLGGGKK